jgi:hypothetical protein
MSDDLEYQAWNNFVQNSYPPAPFVDKARRAAAIASHYMSGANSGGLNSFLTINPELGTKEVLEALLYLNMTETAAQFTAVVAGLGRDLPVSSSDERWEMLEDLWTEDMNELDLLTDQANAELMRVLEFHVRENEAYYAAMTRSY